MNMAAKWGRWRTGGESTAACPLPDPATPFFCTLCAHVPFPRPPCLPDRPEPPYSGHGAVAGRILSQRHSRLPWHDLRWPFTPWLRYSSPASLINLR